MAVTKPESRITKKNTDDYKAYIVDLDGTLYFQPDLRRMMSLHIMAEIIKKPSLIRDILLILRYRRIREQRQMTEREDFTKAQYELAARQTGVSPEHAERTVKHWMIDTPLSYIQKTADNRLISYLNRLSDNGSKVIVYSDYPTEQKLSVLPLKASSSYHSDQPLIQCMKPGSKGLQVILEREGLSPSDCLFIGDRYEKDGLCAKGLDMDYIILPRSQSERERVYHNSDSFIHLE